MLPASGQVSAVNGNSLVRASKVASKTSMASMTCLSSIHSRQLATFEKESPCIVRTNLFHSSLALP